MWEHIDNRSDIVVITNAIHLGTWVDQNMLDTAEYGNDLWAPHQKNKEALIDYIKEKTGQELNKGKLLIGFSRRAAPYKRSDFIFAEESIVGPLFENQTIQVVFSGKAHTLDDVGKDIVIKLVEVARKYPQSVAFIEDYNMATGAALTRGSDIWLNNPRRPKEASGTSGMKAAMNGVLNFSILDGCWAEACDYGVNGWQFGDGYENEDKLDAHDIKGLYKVLQEDVIPTIMTIERSGWK